eukprot:CAMPEP_0117677098 /NCGR_PEP_ID=MMETSP0804-20121206/16560_1 /TAXON_ID=1074897 /ORGANISM="Tetraselmis astigmatica, Strain CCMP880" /LENGTH=153 /DNA_ID=CAMNT_0005486351 /DNA_START=373 /DNA_END=835 /DNA_ORIENTATION=+
MNGQSDPVLCPGRQGVHVMLQGWTLSRYNGALCGHRSRFNGAHGGFWISRAFGAVVCRFRAVALLIAVFAVAPVAKGTPPMKDAALFGVFPSQPFVVHGLAGPPHPLLFPSRNQAKSDSIECPVELRGAAELWASTTTELLGCDIAAAAAADS